MERLVPEILRAYADALEDTRRADNIESMRHLPDLDQKMLLALNGASDIEFPAPGTVLTQLQQRLISVATSDGQGASLGIFYTNSDPFNKMRARPTVGIFPRYAEITDYHLRPEVDLYSLERRGELRITDESASEMDPFLLPNPQGPDFILFKKSPFIDAEPYQTVRPDSSNGRLLSPQLVDEALEQNVMARALFIATVKHSKPALFKQEGFATFMRENRSDPQYSELYSTFKDKRSYYSSGWLEY